MTVSELLNQLGEAVDTAKAKADIVEQQRADLAAYTADRQAEIDQAAADAANAKTAAEALQDQARSMIGDILAPPSPRFRIS